MRVLHITNNYPTEKNPDYGVFTKDQIDGLGSKDFDNELIFINSKENGKKEYFLAIKKIRKIHANIFHTRLREGSEYVCNNFSIKNTCNNYYDLYRQCME